jgi:hypothetical protein
MSSNSKVDPKIKKAAEQRAIEVRAKFTQNAEEFDELLLPLLKELQELQVRVAIAEQLKPTAATEPTCPDSCYDCARNDVCYLLHNVQHVLRDNELLDVDGHTRPSPWTHIFYALASACLKFKKAHNNNV